MKVTICIVIFTLTMVSGLHQVHNKHHSNVHSSHHKSHGHAKHNYHHERSARNRRAEDDAKVVKDNAKPKATTVLPDVPLGCSADIECTNFTGSVCKNQICDCSDLLNIKIEDPPTCLSEANLKDDCQFSKQCQATVEDSECDVVKKVCTCMKGYMIQTYGSENSESETMLSCVREDGGSQGRSVDPAMIGVLAGLALMFVIICVVLRLFSKARFRETRSIFNTANPRLMNASLFKDSKLSPGRSGERRGSRISVRAPSRAASITSMNKDFPTRSPNGSLAKGRRGSSLSTASATAGGAQGARRPSRTSKSPSPSTDSKKPQETTVAIETVD